MKKIRLFILIAVCGIITACGGGGGTTTTPDSFTPESKTQVVGPGGGSITHTLANGAVFQIDIPAGALTSDTTFTFTTQKPTEGQRFNYLLQPAGLVLANSAATTITSGNLNVDKTSILVLNGPIQTLQCPSEYAGGTESLTISLDGTTITTLSSAPYLNNPLPINLATALEAAHPGATGNLTSATLTISRTGTPCNGFWGSNPSPLLTLKLSLVQSKIAFVHINPTGLQQIGVINPDGSAITLLVTNGVTPAW